jgi:peptide deformylase
MAVRDIRYFGDPVLMSPADPVTRFDRNLEALITDLLDTVRPDGRAGLAAPQIGVGLRAFSYDVEGVLGYVINPEIVELSEEEQDGDEGCLSVPGLWYPTRRAQEAVVRGVDLRNEPITVRGRGCWRAACSTRPTISTGSCTCPGSLPNCGARRCARRGSRSGSGRARPESGQRQ